VIRSMTGFGRSDFELEGVLFSLEIRTVNHRHLDVSIRLPRLFSTSEAGLRLLLQGHFRRGKVDVSVTARSGSAVRAEPEIDREVAERYLAFADQLGGDSRLRGGLSVDTLLTLPGVARLVEHAVPPEAAEAAVAEALERAAADAEAMRGAEGGALERELRSRLDVVEALTLRVAERAGEVVTAARERLRKRAEQLREEVGALDDARLHQEVVLAADRLDVTEELVRMRSHIEQFRGRLGGAADGEPVGRSLEFLLQEMLREINTTGSKASDAEVAHLVVDLKTELERIREQVMNVE
jgi:uncharacterized protein (TIGR00255 family)